MPETEGDIDEVFCAVKDRVVMAMVEHVGARPSVRKFSLEDGSEAVQIMQGASSAWRFAQGYGFLRGLLVAHKIPREYVPPGKWQFKMRCLTRGEKNVTKSRAQQLYPFLKITHYIADAILIARYCWLSQGHSQPKWEE
jgi:hypothetical protein